MHARNVELMPMNVTLEMYKDYLISKVLPEIQEETNCWKNRTIYIRQYNDRLHLNENEMSVNNAFQVDEWKRKYSNQPPNSPEVSILGLGFF